MMQQTTSSPDTKAAKPAVILPDKYYLHYFRYVADFIRQMYPTMLGAQEGFLHDFESLSEEAQCLYLRINSRRGWYFRPSKLTYREIPDMADTVRELIDLAFVRRADTSDLPDMITPVFTKAEWYAWLEAQGVDPLPRRSASRAEIVEAVIAHFDINRLLDFDDVIVQEHLEHMELITIMFFGSPYGDLSQFVVRDIGHVAIPHQRSDHFTPYFETREQIDQQWQLLQWYREYKLLEAEETDVGVLWEWLEEKVTVFEGLFDTSRVVADKLLYRAGQYMERRDALGQAVVLYGWSRRPQAIERKLRVMVKAGSHDNAASYAQWLADHGPNANLKLLGSDYLKKKKTKGIRRSTTEKIETAQLIDVVYTGDDRIERLVLEHLGRQGYAGFFSENYIWRSLFGLVFWDQLYAEDATLHQPLQRLPSDIYSGYYQSRKHELKAHLSRFRSSAHLGQWLDEKIERVHGEGNPFVHWHVDLKSHIETFLAWMTIRQIQSVLLEMAKNPRENCTGFPDLFVYTDDRYYFYEVKSPNDHLSAQQLFWIDFFEQQGINVDILRTK